MIINGRKYIHVLTAGTYNGVVFTNEDIENMARYYNPMFREAALWKGHHSSTHVGKEEQEALGWVFPVIALSGKLYIAFSYISQELYTLVSELKYKYVSVEVLYYKLLDETVIPYLSGLGLTNRPAVEGLEPLSFDSEDISHLKFTSVPPKAVVADNVNSFTEKFDKSKVVKYIQFEYSVNNYSNNQNQNQMTVTETTKKTLTALKIDPAKFVTEEGAQDAIQKVASDALAKVTELEGKVTSLTAAPSTKADDKESPESKRIAALETKLAVDLVNRAIADKKILPAEKDAYVELAQINYERVEKSFTTMQPRAELAGEQIDTTKQPDLKDAKFVKADGTALTADDLDKNPALIAERKLSLEDCEAIYKKAGREV